MSKESKLTLAVYEAKALDWVGCQSRKHNQEPAKYEQRQLAKQARIERFLDGMSPNPLVLEIGAGTGDDYYLFKKLELGCRVVLSDGAQAFVDIMKEKGLDAFLLDFDQKKIPGIYDVIYANHVLIHMTPDDIVRILPKIYGALRPRGRFIFNVGNVDGDCGDYAGWRDLPGFHKLGADRFFYYWKNTHIIRVVEEAGFCVKKYEVDGGTGGRRWIEICAIKP